MSSLRIPRTHTRRPPSTALPSRQRLAGCKRDWFYLTLASVGMLQGTLVLVAILWVVWYRVVRPAWMGLNGYERFVLLFDLLGGLGVLVFGLFFFWRRWYVHHATTTDNNVW